MNGPHAALRALPSISAVLATNDAQALVAARSHASVSALARGVIEAMRGELLRGELSGAREALLAVALDRMRRVSAAEAAPRPRRVINATGVVLHTNLGRAPLGDGVLRDVREASLGYAALEYDLERGARGHRDAEVTPALVALTGAEDAVVVNNGAAAVLLTCTAIAAGREVVVSRGELVEIGGGFRIPEVIASCGATLVEVGATNRTRVDDFERAIGAQTAAILQVHQSNFAMRGFTSRVALPALAALSRARGVALLVDLGSGALVDTRALGIPREPTAADALRSGADLVMFSGDKLLGGPQAGVIVGSRALIARVRRHPLMRALRPGRLVLAALAATLRRYADGRASRDLPVLAMLSEGSGSIRARADALAERLGAEADVVATEGRVGGGTLPEVALPSWAVRLRGPSTALAAALRRGDPPVIGRCVDGALLIDLRTVADHELDALERALRSALARSTETEHAPAQTDLEADPGQEDE